MEKFLTSEQVAQILQVHPFTVLKYLKSGSLNGIKIGRVYRIKESDVEKFLGDMAIKKTPKANQTPKQEEPEAKPESKVSEPELPEPPKPLESEVHSVKFEDDEEKEPSSQYYKVL